MGKKSCSNCKYFVEGGKTWGICNVPLPPWAWLISEDISRIVENNEANSCLLFTPKPANKKGEGR